MTRFFKLIFSSFVLGLFFVANSYATTININPGSVGSTFNDITIPFSEINGHAVINGNSIIPLEFVFANSKNVTVQTNSDAFFMAEIDITITGDADDFFPATNGSLRDADGNILLSNWSSLNSTAGGGNTVNYKIGWADFITPVLDGMTFSGVYFNSIGFPVGDRGVIQSASLRLRFNGTSGEALVGLTNPVPIPTTMLLFSTGLIGLAGLRKRFKTS